MEAIRYLNDCAVRSLQQCNSTECKAFLSDALERLKDIPVHQPHVQQADQSSVVVRENESLHSNHGNLASNLSGESSVPRCASTTAYHPKQEGNDGATVSPPATTSPFTGTTQSATEAVAQLNHNSYTVERITFRSIPGTFHDLAGDDEYEESGDVDSRYAVETRSNTLSSLSSSLYDNCDYERYLGGGGQPQQTTMGARLEEEAFPLYARPFVFDFTAPFDLRWVGNSTMSRAATLGGSPIAEPRKLLPSQRILCCAACLYNLGLANSLEYRNYKEGRTGTNIDGHQATEANHSDREMRESGDNGTTDLAGDDLLEQAVVLYEIAYHILVQMSHVPAGDSAMILVLAVCNNIASVHHSLGNLTACEKWKQQLAAVLHLCNVSSLEDQDSLGFFYFTAHLLPDFHSARAA